MSHILSRLGEFKYNEMRLRLPILVLMKFVEMVRYILDSGKMEKDMAVAHRYGRMEPVSRAIGKMIKHNAGEDLSTRMVAFMKEYDY